MIEITISWHCALLFIALAIGIIWVFTLDDTEGFLGSSQTWGCFVFIIIAVIAIAIYGGIFWW